MTGLFRFPRSHASDDIEGRLTAGGIVKTGLGGTAVTRRKDNGKLVSIADDFKKAEADALKRCCRLLGVGGELYGGEGAGDEASEALPSPPATSMRNPASSSAADRVTSAQLAKLRHMVAEAGADWAAYRADVRERVGVNLEFLNKRAASTLIDELVARARRRSGNGSGRGGHHGHDADVA